VSRHSNDARDVLVIQRNLLGYPQRKRRNAPIGRAGLATHIRRRTHFAEGLSAECGTMASSDVVYNYDRYRSLLAEADDEPKRLAFINLLIQEKAKDQLVEQLLRDLLSGLGLKNSSMADAPGANNAAGEQGIGRLPR
jgi:hypothetical protein